MGGREARGCVGGWLSAGRRWGEGVAGWLWLGDWGLAELAYAWNTLVYSWTKLVYSWTKLVYALNTLAHSWNQLVYSWNKLVYSWNKLVLFLE